MRETRAHFKYALRFARKQEETAKADLLARDLSDKDVDGFFWKQCINWILIVLYRLMLLAALQGKTAKTILLIIGDNTFISY